MKVTFVFSNIVKIYNLIECPAHKVKLETVALLDDGFYIAKTKRSRTN